jgi:hypothetical protein
MSELCLRIPQRTACLLKQSAVCASQSVPVQPGRSDLGSNGFELPVEKIRISGCWSRVETRR